MGIEERQQQREIDGVTYIVNPLPHGIAKHGILRLTKIAGPSLAQAIGGGGSPQSVGGAIGMLVGGLEPSDVAYFEKEFGNASWYLDGTKRVPLVLANQEAHFENKLLGFFEWLAFCIEVNYAPFLSGLLAKFGVTVSRLGQVTRSTSAEKTG